MHANSKTAIATQKSWDHISVFLALRLSGMRRSKPTIELQYVALYEQRTNCALLYAPDVLNYAASSPFIFKQKGRGWKQEYFDKLAPFLVFRKRHYLSGVDSYSVRGDTEGQRLYSWDGIAEVLGLNQLDKMQTAWNRKDDRHS